MPSSQIKTYGTSFVTIVRATKMLYQGTSTLFQLCCQFVHYLIYSNVHDWTLLGNVDGRLRHLDIIFSWRRLQFESKLFTSI